MESLIPQFFLNNLDSKGIKSSTDDRPRSAGRPRSIAQLIELQTLLSFGTSEKADNQKKLKIR